MRKTIQHGKQKGMITVLIGLLIAVCVSPQCVVQAEPEEKHSIQGKLLVLPFQNMSELYGKDKHVRCPVCGKVFLTGEVPDKSTDYLSDKMVLMLRQDRYYKKIVTSGSPWGNTDLMSNENRTLSELKLIMAAGRAAKADVVMVAYLYRFRQRVGSRVSVETPASVAFGLHLIDVNSGRQLWKGHMDETQRPLSENLFKIDSFIKRKASWITAEEMAVSGLKKNFKALPEK